MDKTLDFRASDPSSKTTSVFFSFIVYCNTIQNLYLSRFNLTRLIPTWSRWRSTLVGPLEASIAGLPELGRTVSKP